MNNNNVGRSFFDSSVPSFKVYGNKIGTTYLQITDSAGKLASVEVVVKAKVVIPQTVYE
jgi:hypothetical protein